MTSSSTRLIELAHTFATHGDSVDERVDSVILRGSFVDSDEQRHWLEFRSQPPTPFESVQVYDTEIMGDLDAEEAFSSDRIVTLTLVKPCHAKVAVFVFSTGLAAFLKARSLPPCLLSAELESRAAFQAHGLDVAPWNVSHIFKDPSDPIQINPRKLVRDYVPDREITEDLSPWILSTEPEVISVEYAEWRKQGARRLLGGLVNSAVLEDGKVWFQASGPPMFRIQAEDINVSAAWEALTTAAKWVYLSGSDTDVRYLIFAGELARVNRPDLSLDCIVDYALEGSKTTYEAHVQSASRETLKALADLRKTVIDETQKVTQRAQNLTDNLWRDAAVSAAPFVVKIVGDATATPFHGLAAGFCFGAAILIVVSFALRWRINKTFLDNQQEARARWFEMLYLYISNEERKGIAETPIGNAVRSYNEVLILVGSIYAAIAVILVGFGAAMLHR